MCSNENSEKVTPVQALFFSKNAFFVVVVVVALHNRLQLNAAPATVTYLQRCAGECLSTLNGLNGLILSLASSHSFLTPTNTTSYRAKFAENAGKLREIVK